MTKKQAWQAVLDDLNDRDLITVNIGEDNSPTYVRGEYRGLERYSDGTWYLVICRKNGLRLIDTKLINWIVRK